MTTTTEQVFIEALSLPTRQRAVLVHKLLLSLEPDECSLEVQAAWKQEARERCQAFDEGKLTDREAEDVLRDTCDKLE